MSPAPVHFELNGRPCAEMVDGAAFVQFSLTATNTGGSDTFASATAPLGCTVEATSGETVTCP